MMYIKTRFCLVFYILNNNNNRGENILMINYNLIIVVMLFIILMSIQYTLNKIYVVLKDIKEILNLKKIKER